MRELIEQLQPYLIGAWQHRWLALGVAWLVCLAGWSWVGLMPNRYTSEARLYVDTQTILAPLMQGIAVTPDIEQQVEMMRRTLLSRPNVEQLVRMTDLDHDVDGDLELENLVGRLTREVHVSVDGANLFNVSYEHTDRDTAYRVVDAILQIFVEQNLGHTQRDVESAREFIDKRLEEYEEKLRQAELKVAEFRREHAEELGGVERNLRELEVAQSSLRLLETQLEAAIWRRDQLNLELAKIPARVAASDAGLSQLSPAELKLRELKEQLARALLIYTERHPDVRALRARIAQLEEEFGEEGTTPPTLAGGRTVPNPVHAQLASDLRRLESEIDNLERRISLEQEEIRRLAQNVAEAPQVEADLKRLTRDYDVLAEQHTQLVQRREAAQLAQRLDMDTSTVEFRVVDPPTRPLKPSGPPHGILMAGVLVVGLGSGVAGALARVLLGTTFSSEVELRTTLQLPILGSVGAVPLGYKRTVNALERCAFAGGLAGLLLSFGIVFYLYQLSSAKPDLATLARDLPQRVGEQVIGSL